MLLCAYLHNGCCQAKVAGRKTLSFPGPTHRFPAGWLPRWTLRDPRNADCDNGKDLLFDAGREKVPIFSTFEYSTRNTVACVDW
jgi:hypothetical protein